MATNKPAPATPDKPKRKGLMIGLIAGGAALLVCCCTGVGGTIVGFVYLFPRGQEAALVGTWRTKTLEYEFRSDKKMKLRNLVTGGHLDLVYRVEGSNVLELKGDTAGNNTLNGQPYPTRRFNFTLSGDTLTLRELSPEPDPEGVTFKRG